ncbi:MAG: VanZ family protein [Thermodesulfobacteriota bacterium]
MWLLSSDYFSGDQTGGILLPLLELLLPGVSPTTLVALHGAVRKLAHVTEYAILAILLVRALERPRRAVWTTATAALVIGAGYAVVDELHQTWVPSRVGSPIDVALDACGTLLGVALATVLSAGRRSRA